MVPHPPPTAFPRMSHIRDGNDGIGRGVSMLCLEGSRSEIHYSSAAGLGAPQGVGRWTAASVWLWISSIGASIWSSVCVAERHEHIAGTSDTSQSSTGNIYVIPVFGFKKHCAWWGEIRGPCWRSLMKSLWTVCSCGSFICAFWSTQSMWSSLSATWWF